MLSTTTIVVLLGNGITAIIAAALLMLVLWEAPCRRMNQLFALMMTALLAYSYANGLGRFIDRFGFDPARMTYVAISFMGLFVVAIFFFASEFAGEHSLVTRVMRLLGLLMIVTNNLALWSGRLLVDIHPTGSGDGSYEGTWTTLGVGAILTILGYLLMTTLVLRRMDNERGRALWLGPALVSLSLISSTALWPIVHIPLQAIGLALAALALGIPVLRYELFNPLAQLHIELAQKNAELQKANETKNQFLTNMSHELRTPLNSVIGYSELVLKGTYGALNDTQRDRLQKVVRNGYNLLGLINDVLDLNQIETGRLFLERRPVDTAALINRALETIEPLARQKGLAIKRNFDGAPPINGDPVRVRQIVTNILANAVKFTPRGHITIQARQDGDHVLIAISDTGIGIAPDQHERVFVEFQQVDGSVTREYEGSGLGLAITKRLVELHGGRIWLASAPQEGTTVYVTLPAAANPARRSQHTTSPAAPEPPVKTVEEL